MIPQKEVNRRQNQFSQKTINERISPEKIICPGGLLKSSGGFATIPAKIILCPTYPDPTAEQGTEAYTGRAYYRCRRITDKTTTYDEETEYVVGDKVIASNNLKYTSIDGTIEDPNVGHDPVDDDPENPVYWEVDEEIKIEYILGSDDDAGNAIITGFDIRDCGPGFVTGALVELTSRVIPVIGTRHYIKGMFYCGTQENASIRVDLTDESMALKAVLM